MVSRLGRLQGWKIPLIFLGVVLISYGLWIPWLGLFGNDLPYLWYYHVLGPWGPGVYAASDRPVSALFYAASTLVFGETVWPYHIFMLGLRWLSAVLLWWVMGIVWPERKQEAALAAVLFAIYPGFRQNPIALEFILHFFVLDLFLLSLGTMLLAFCRPQNERLLQGLTMAGASGLFFSEYFIGLEVMRPIFLWILAQQQGLPVKARWRRIARAWLPSLLVVAAFLFWRVVIFSFPSYKPVLFDMLRTSPLSALVFLFKRAAQDLWTSLGGAWLQTLRISFDRRLLPGYAGLALTSAALMGLLWKSIGKNRSSLNRADFWGETLLGLGLLFMLAGGAIFWITSIPITLEFPWDRSTLPLMLGASLALAGLLEMVVVPRYRMVLAGGLVILAVGMHFLNAYEYQAEWGKLQDFFWQLTWRAPQLEPGTLALFDVMPLNRYSDNDLTSMLNWTYAPESSSMQISYKFFDLTLRLGSNIAGLPGFEKDLPVEHNQRGTFFKTTTSSTLALTYNPPACLKILGRDDALLPDLPERLQRALPMTRLEQIHTSGTPARPPAVLGNEPAHRWCYYFQKAELARQQGDWPMLVSYADQAFEAGLNPGDPAELLPMVEGYARVGNLDRAVSLGREAGKQANLHPALCALWTRVGEQTGKDQGKAAKAASVERSELNCSP